MKTKIFVCAGLFFLGTALANAQAIRQPTDFVFSKTFL